MKAANSIFSGLNIREKLQLACMVAFTITLCLEFQLNSLIMILVLFSLLFSFSWGNLVKHRRPILFFVGFFVIALVSLAWSLNKQEGWKVVERQLTVFFIPVMFFSAVKRGYSFSIVVLRAYYASIFLLCLFLIKQGAENFLSMNVTLKEWTVKEHLYHAFAKPLNMHATYMSLYVGLAIFLGFFWLLGKIAWWRKTLIFLSLILLVITLALLSSRVVIGSVVFILVFVFPFFIGKLRNKFGLSVIGLSLATILIIIIGQSEFISDRFIDKVADEITMKPFLKNDSTYNPVYGGETRADRWYCAAELIRESPLIGYGTGSEKDVLLLKFAKYNLQNALVNRYDAHNQYLAFTIKAGIFGLLSFLAALSFGFYSAIRRRHFLYLAFMLLITISCVTENVLESNKGIFFYAFFNVVLFLFSQGEESSSGSGDATREQEQKR